MRASGITDEAAVYGGSAGSAPTAATATATARISAPVTTRFPGCRTHPERFQGTRAITVAMTAATTVPMPMITALVWSMNNDGARIVAACGSWAL